MSGPGPFSVSPDTGAAEFEDADGADVRVSEAARFPVDLPADHMVVSEDTASKILDELRLANRHLNEITHLED